MKSDISMFSVMSTVLVLIDVAFIILFLSKPFNQQILAVQKEPIKMNMYGTFASYALIIFILYYFIIKDRRSIIDAFLLGLLTYGIYDATNYATLKNWSASTSIIDTCWGGTLFALTTFITYKLV